MQLLVLTITLRMCSFINMLKKKEFHAKNNVNIIRLNALLLPIIMAFSKARKQVVPKVTWISNLHIHHRRIILLQKYSHLTLHALHNLTSS